MASLESKSMGTSPNTLLGSSVVPIIPAVTSTVYPQIIIKVAIPNHGLQKALRCSLGDTVATLKKQLLEKTSNEIPNAFNYGFFIPGAGGKVGKFLEEKRELHTYKFEGTVAMEFVQKCRVPVNGTSPSVGDFELTPALKKRNKAFIEDCAKQNYERVKEKCKLIDPNCWSDEEGAETPLISAIMNDDREMINILVENGAHLDYRLGAKDQWKSPLHIASMHNKLKSVQILLAAGAWGMITDMFGLTPLYYAATNGSKEIVHRLLVARSSTEIFDENGKGPLHQACLNNHDQVAWLLIDFGAQMNAKNISGNTPLHVSATRNSTECAKYLLLRGANKNILNKVNQQPVQVAIMSQNLDLAEMISKHKDEDIIPAPPKPAFNDIGEIPSLVLAATKARILGVSKLRKSLLLHPENNDDINSKSALHTLAKSLADLDMKATSGSEGKSCADLDATGVESIGSAGPGSLSGVGSKVNSARNSATPEPKPVQPIALNVSNVPNATSGPGRSNILRVGMEGSSYQIIDSLKFILAKGASSEDLNIALNDLDTLKGMLDRMNVKLMRIESEKTMFMNKMVSKDL